MGPFAMRTAVLLGLVAAIAGSRAVAHPSEDGRVRRVAVGAAGLAAVVAAVAVGRLAWAFWSADLSLVYVADHTRRGADRATRLSGVWGGMGGSLLFYAVGTGVAGSVAMWRATARDRVTVAAVTGAAVAAFTGIALLWSDPFAHLSVPAVDGAGLTPILEHPAMRYHPPLLYAGLTSLLAPFAITVAALVHRRVDDDWASRTARWLLVPWTLLAVGMLAGAHWAYVELGWGGYWAWDPVENTALLPWLAVTATLHLLLHPTATASAPRSRPSHGAAAGVCGAFVLSILGGLLSRSGATSSVHAFAEARSIGRAFAAVLGLVSVGVVVLFVRARRGAGASDGRRPAEPRGLVLSLAGHQIVVLGTLLVVLVGSLWPLLEDLRGGQGLAVEGWYFAMFCGPLAVAALLLMAAGPALVDRAPRSAALWLGSGLAAGLITAVAAGWRGLFALATAAAGGAAITGAGWGAVRSRAARRRLAPHLAHLGVAMFLLGVAGTTTGATELHRLAVGGRVEVHGHVVVNHGVRVVGDDAQSVVADLRIDGRGYAPRLVAHPERRVVLAESALHSTPTLDLQVMLRDARDDGSVLLQVGVHPLQQLVWWGGLLVVAAGAVALASSTRASTRAAARA